MCQKLAKRNVKTPVPVCFLRVAAIMVIFIFVECAAGRYEIKKSRGSCLSYGHACWGAHGKRSGLSQTGSLPLPPNDETASNSKDEAKAKWLFSKLLSPLDARYYHLDGNDADAPKSLALKSPVIEDLFADIEGENIKSLNDWESVRDSEKNGNRFEETGGSGKNLDNWFRSPRFMIKRSTKQ